MRKRLNRCGHVCDSEQTALGFDSQCQLFGAERFNVERFNDGSAKLVAQIFRYSRSRLVCVRLTGISLAFSSFIVRMKFRLNHGTISLI